ncbi:N-acetyltransferase [Mesorhizobium sp. KR9-304]|uniref:GNAT family N-acetyltransferase n=1 Tax=Mesorhizobium sp. KR9-304 TaxID=3156614 RepID=UPI0032B4F52B
MTQIRAMTEQDVPAVSRLMGDSWRRTYGPIVGEDTAARISGDKHSPERLASDLTDADTMSFVAERTDGAIVGYAMAQFKDGDVMLDRLHVDKSEFGTGVAVDLLHAVLAAHAGMPSIALEVLEGNDRALAFYKKHGFEVVERRAAPHGAAGHSSLIMRRLLSRA